MNGTYNSSTTTNISTQEETKCAIEDANSITKTLVILGFALVLVSSLVGNSLLIRVALWDKEARKKFPFNFLIINMAIADIMNASSASLVFILFLKIGRRWVSGIFGQISCKVLYFTVGFSVAASILTVVVMGLDRLMAAHATIRPLTKKGVRQAMALIWILAGLFCIPYFYIFKVEEGPDGKHYCIRRWSEDIEKHIQILEIEELTKFVVLYVLPLIFMVICYAIIACRIRRRSELPVGSNTRSKIVQQNQRVVRMIVAIVVIFAVCWLPVHVNHLLRSFDVETYCKLPAFLILSFFWLAHANCAINPWVWFMFSRHFRGLLKASTSIKSIEKRWTESKKGRNGHIPLTAKRSTMKRLIIIEENNDAMI
ncbi:hypothetical protein OS493_018874 [Desmophyllum pertusum]|uniref:G-protein coupled receptors family 1 profile domain-containing protein n=1 Tax=Desmophyllum pertusum TaxID=174260 RepID=A0A9X0CX02_9CNID|nr:hypothetical protein OS493_018874 [Desmophyllum pertusum]